jgi:ankyrin repeat protein
MKLIRLLIAATLAGTLCTSAQTSTNKVALIPIQELVEAALYGKADIITKALEQGFDVNKRDAENRTVLMYAAFNGHAAIVKQLIEAEADVNVQDTIGTSALMFAASGPSTETVQVLLDAGAEINMVDKNEHFSALMWAAAEGQVENVKLLLSKGADLTLKDVDGDTAESFARKAGHTAVADILKAAATEKTEETETKK